MSKEKELDLSREEKVDRVYLALCRGLDRTAILEYARENEWKDHEPDIDKMIEEAESKLAEAAANIDIGIETGKAIARLNELYQVAFKCQDFKTALSIQKEINRRLELALKQREKAQPATKQREPEQRRGIRLVK